MPLALIVAAVAALVPVDGASAASITGKVQYVGPSVAPKKLFVTVDPFVCGKDKDDEEISDLCARGLHNVVTRSRHRAGRPVAVLHGAGVPRSAWRHSPLSFISGPGAAGVRVLGDYVTVTTGT